MTASAAAPRRRSDLGIRAVTGIILIVVAIACLVDGMTPFWMLGSLAALAMMAEWSGLIGAERWKGWAALTGLATMLLVEQPHLGLPHQYGLAILLVATLAIAAITRNLRLAAGMLYAGLPTLSLFFLRDQYNGPTLTLWALAIVWATDIGAYFAGRSIGGPKLAPVLSPNKTWSGLIGGTVAAIVVAFLLARTFHLSAHLPGYAGLLAICAQGGDVYESAMKRRAGVKDSGHILPGHGGAMDRLDGAVPVLCLVALITLAGIV